MTYVEEAVDRLFKGESPRKVIAETCGIVYNNLVYILRKDDKAVALAKSGKEKELEAYINANCDRLHYNMRFSRRQARRVARELTKIYVDGGVNNG